MNSTQLALDAIAFARPFFDYLRAEHVQKIALSHVAIWLSQQDDSIHSRTVRETANAAIAQIIAHYA